MCAIELLFVAIAIEDPVVVVVGAAHCTGFFSIIFNIYTSITINYNDTINHDELLS